jgi:DNA-binding GntR family transcriptional regulator
MDLIDAIDAGDGERAAKVARAHTEQTRTAYHRPVPHGGQAAATAAGSH